MTKEVMSYAADLGVAKNIEFRFNASKEGRGPQAPSLLKGLHLPHEV